MTACSTKRLSPNSWLFLLIACSSAFAVRDYDAEFRLELNSRLAYHVFAPQDLASHRHTLDLEQRFKADEFSGVVGVQALAETAYAANPRYDSDVAKAQSQELVARDIYLQYKDRRWLVRAGNQQVIWGEAFGFYFADIVNPKDRRDFGLGDLSRQRLPVPMLQVKHIFDKSSIQAIYIPKPFFNKEPYRGSDFGNIYPELPISDDRSMPLAWHHGEAGVRMTREVMGVDFSTFFLYYHDRAPNYRLTGNGLEGFHERLHSFGATATAEMAPFVFRMEGLHTIGRLFDTVVDNQFLSLPSRETTGVLGVDLTSIPNWRVGVQASDVYLSQEIPGVDQHRPLLTVLMSGPVYRDQTVEVILSYVPTDGSSLAQFRYLTPLSSRIELLFGADVLMGGSQSQFGKFKSGSRGYVLLKGYLMGT